MTKREEKVIERIVAVDDRGTEYRIALIQEYLVSEGERIESLRRFELQGGGAVNRIDENTFQLVSRGVTVTRK